MIPVILILETIKFATSLEYISHFESLVIPFVPSHSFCHVQIITSTAFHIHFSSFQNYNNTYTLRQIDLLYPYNSRYFNDANKVQMMYSIQVAESYNANSSLQLNPTHYKTASCLLVVIIFPSEVVKQVDDQNNTLVYFPYHLALW